MERYYPKDRHHMLWERAQFNGNLKKRVRKMAAFLIDVPIPNHRLIHASMIPSDQVEVDPDTLRRMESLAVGGLQVVINKIHHPIAGHLESQLEIASMDTDEAMERIDAGEYWVGPYSRPPRQCTGQLPLDI